MSSDLEDDLLNSKPSEFDLKSDLDSGQDFSSDIEHYLIKKK